MEQKKAWKRVLTVILTSRKLKKSFTFGANYLQGKDDLSIKATVKKYMSSLKDTAIIEIDNLTYSETTQIVMGEFYDVQIWCGYQKGNINKIFDGGVLYISNRLNSDKTNTIVILCASNIVAKYGQSRINLTLNSGINLYSAIEFICRRAGVPNSNVSTQFKKVFLEEVMNVNDTAGSWLDKLCNVNETYITNSDSIMQNTFSIFDSALSNSRVIKLKNSDILLTGGYPRLTSDGLSLSMLPTFNFMCGDIIKIDNSILDISITSREEISKNYAAYFSQKGEYMITEMTYVLKNRAQTFNLELSCKNRDRITAYIGE